MIDNEKTEVTPMQDVLSARDQLKAKLKQRKDAAVPLAPKIRRLGDSGRVLSFSQQRLWLLDQLMGASAVYNISFAIRLEDRLNIDILQRCLQTITDRHEALRTRFVAENGDAKIIVDDVLDLQLQPEDVNSIDEVLAIWRDERDYLFDISKEALFRARLLREAADSHVLVVTMHHIVSDAWSLGVFFKELVSLYRDFSRGLPSSLTELPIQFSDYASWQRQSLTDAVLSEQARYWEQQLANLPSLLMLPADHPRPLEQRFKGATEAIHIPADLGAALQQLSKAQGATLFMSLLSAFSILLGRYAGQNDIVVGAPVANRMRREAEGLIGFFVNTLVMRTSLSGNPTFNALLGKVRETALQAYAHQDLPFEYLVETLNPERSLSHSPLFQVMFILQNAPMDTVAFEGVKVSSLNGERMDGFSRFDITLSLAEGKDGLKGVFEYNTDLFERSTICRMVDHFLRLLRAIVAAPDSQIAALNFLSEQERQQQFDWNDTYAAYAPRCIHEAIAQQVERTPNAIAVIAGEMSISYTELETKAGQLALLLRQDGLNTGEHVGICMDRSIDMVVAMYAVLKAGATYVAIDPDYPQSRISYIIKHAEISRLLSQYAVQEKLLRQSPDMLDGVTCWCVELLGLNQRHDADTLPPLDVTGDHAAYVIYTSGSTGIPKGVVGRHCSVMNRLQWMAEQYPVSQDEVFCQKTSVGFVDHVAEIFQALTCGAPLVIFPTSYLQSPPDFLRVLQQHKVTRLTLVPSLLHALLAEKDVPACTSLRLLITSGETMIVKDRRSFHQRFPNARLLNLYGSTEVAADVTGYELGMQDESAVPIGRAIANTQVYVLGTDGQLLPRGAVGELFVGGDGLAHGYLKQAGLTAGRFVPNAFSVRPGTRLYRTGDLVRYKMNGDLEYLGRTDHQVKIRGFRIEPGEVDVALCTHPGVESAVTVVYKGANGEDQLVAYVIASTNAENPQTMVAQLKEALKSSLPHYMVPAFIQRMDTFPLTPSGKVDRRALPAPEQTENEHEEPVGEYETLLAGLWLEVLKCKYVGRHDNFFDLGGHSLLVTQLVSRIRERFQVELPLLSIFEHQTVQEQAQLIVAGKVGETVAEHARAIALVPLNKATRLLPQTLSFAQQRLWFLDQLMGANPSYNIPLALRLQGELDLSLLERSLNCLIERHESLRTCFVKIDDEARQLVKPYEKRFFPVELVADEIALKQAALEERMHCFDLGGESLLRIRLLRSSHAGEHEHLLLVTIHHIVADGWSLGIFFQEMVALYRAFQADTPQPLAELPLQYIDFAAWQKTWLENGVQEKQLHYWRKQLADLPAVLDLPTNRPRPSEQKYRGAGVDFTFSAELLSSLKQLCREQGITLFMTLLSAYAALLQRYTGQDDIAVGTPIANRMQRDFEKVIGLFANTLVMRVDLSGEPSFIELLKRTRQMALDAYAHQDIPFERLVEELNPARSLSYSPLFQVMFVLQNAPMDVQKLDGLSVSTMESPEEGIARFDLHLAMGEINNQLSGRIDYNSDLFDRSRIVQFVEHLENLLKAIVAGPDLAVSRIDYLSAEERQRQLLTLNDTSKAFPQDATLKALFEEQVARTPDAVALQFEGETLTYLELNTRANQLANHLIAKGVLRDECIGLCTERSLEMVIGLYGILKAGCAYLPLDPEYPHDRIRHIIDEAQVRYIISHQGFANEFADQVREGGVIDLGNVDANIVLSACSEQNTSLPDLTSRHLAYVLYTSGSTGGPKGVMLEHQAVVNRIVWMQDQYQLQTHDVVLQKTPFSFDVSVWEFTWPLLIGAKLVIAVPNGHKDPDYLKTLIREAGVTTLHFVPSMLQAMLSSGNWQACEPVRTVFCSGEALPAELVREFFASGTRSQLHNLYGPTEAAIDVSYWQCHDADSLVNIPIGKPIQNIELHIVDDHMQLVAEGVAGELLIGGVGLARGYIRRPELTQEKFIPHPFSAKAGSRVYRTGDLVRRLPGGDIEYLGRIDNQVKINGFRIELGEIESQLDSLDFVSKSVVVADRDGAAPRLVAYLVLNSPGTEIPVTQIRAHLASSLPVFMIPQLYVALDAIPLSANGKLDRKRLPKVSQDHLASAQYMAPVTDLEKRLAEVWKKNLKLDKVSIADNYFSLGGDSIRSISLVAEARHSGIDFQVKDLFSNPTIMSLGQAIEAGISQHVQAAMPEAFDLISDEEKQALFEQFS
ncbi:amino acid adenylation domain-containing protein [Undibacterium sp. TJN19]|uniref:amino acid adenylation domain-containing protein n=1 Tax=Undibacterium sp. TJN19 TaxID=3413055 RepID=UPI003BF15A3E